MGWGRWLLLGDVGQQLDLGDQAREIDRLKEQLRNANAQGRRACADLTEQVKRLQAENDELKLYVATLFRLAVSKGLTTAEELRGLVRAVDAEDGAVDSAYRGSVLYSQQEIDQALGDS